MIIAKELFDECFCPCDGIGRVCLRGDAINPGINTGGQNERERW